MHRGQLLSNYSTFFHLCLLQSLAFEASFRSVSYECESCTCCWIMYPELMYEYELRHRGYHCKHAPGTQVLVGNESRMSYD